MFRHLIIVLLILMAGCSAPSTDTNTAANNAADFEKLTDELLYGALALSPVSATQTGYHEHNGIPLDEQLDDYSSSGIEAQHRFYQGFQSRIASLNTASLDKEQQADVEIIRNYLNLALLELNTIQNYKHNPTVYVELAGSSLFTPYILNYAPKERRFQHIIKRMEKFPALFEQAKANLMDAPEVWNRVAREENEGTIGLIDEVLRQETPDALKADYDRAAKGALAALKDFSTYLERNFQRKPATGGLEKKSMRENSNTSSPRGKVRSSCLPKRRPT